MGKGPQRTPWHYDGTEPTAKPISSLLPGLLNRIGSSYKERGDIILAAWPLLVGEKIAPMTQAVSFKEGVLSVKVKNSTLYSLLVRHERPRLLKSLQEKFPHVAIHNIAFRMG